MQRKTYHEPLPIAVHSAPIGRAEATWEGLAV